MLGSYLARLAVTMTGSLRRGDAHPLDALRVPMRVWPADIDVYLHVNNGRYLTLMDAGRWDHSLRTGLFAQAVKHRWKPVLGAATVKFRRELKPFEAFELVTQISCWDRKWVYLEQRFEKDGETFAWGAVKAVVKQGRKTVAPAEYLAAVGVETDSPLPGPELQAWVVSQELERPVQLLQ